MKFGKSLTSSNKKKLTELYRADDYELSDTEILKTVLHGHHVADFTEANLQLIH